MDLNNCKRTREGPADYHCTNMGITFQRCVLWYQSFNLTTSSFSMHLDLEGIE